MKNAGFTLIELMITTTIIAVLSIVGVTAFQKVTVNSRDQQRIRDLQTIKQALELYRNDQHYYPSDTTFNPNSMATLAFGSKVYLTLPSDPSGSSSGKKYGYRALPAACDDASTFCISYVLCSQKEGNISYGQGAVKVYDCSSLLPGGVTAPTCGNKVCAMGIASD